MNQLEEILQKHAIVVFDGECNLCDSSVTFIIKHDKNAYFKFTPQQSKIASSVLKDKYGNHIPDSVILITQDGIFCRSSAVLRIATRLDWPWKVLAAFRILPPLLMNPFYRIIAKFRKKLFGGKEVCLLPTPDKVDRFIKS
jgi:predicted DCC family thiol-disulfide oxidoreductase YuxK